MNSAVEGKRENATPTGIKLSIAWAALMSLYIYNDYFNMYMPGTIENMTAGRIGPFDHPSDMTFVFLSLMLAVPALMIYLSAAAPAIVSRWLNILLGAAYIAINVWASSGALSYRIVVGLEIALTVLIVWTAIRWPKQKL